jgi:hypothetical protein
MPHKSREAANAYKRKWRKKNPNVDKAISRRRYLRKREEVIEKGKKYYKENKRKTKNDTLLRKYGISIEDYEQMVAVQGGLCAICGTSAERLVVDHCHESGNIRSLLCNRCNLGIGLFEDNEDILILAAKYIKRYGEINN